MNYTMRLDYGTVEAATLKVGDVVKDHGIVATVHDETNPETGKVTRVVAFGTPAHVRGDGEDAEAKVVQTVLWSPTRKVKRVEVRLVPIPQEKAA